MLVIFVKRANLALLARLKRAAIDSLASTYKFTIDIRPDLWYRYACYLAQTRHSAATLTHLDSALPRGLASCTIFVQITPSE